MKPLNTFLPTNLTEDSDEKGWLVEVECYVTDTISTLKDKLEEMTGISSNSQKLIFGGKRLDDERSLSYYGVEPESIKLVTLGIEQQTMAECHIESNTHLYLSLPTSLSGTDQTLLVEWTHFGQQGKLMRAEGYIEKDPTLALITSISSKDAKQASQIRKLSATHKSLTSKFPIRVTKIATGEIVKLTVSRSSTIKQVLEMIREEEHGFQF